MIRMVPVVLMIHLALCGTCVTSDEGLPLQLIRYLPVEGPDNLQPSGLTMRNGTLFTVSDKHDSVIFKLTLKDDAAHCSPAIVFHDAKVLNGDTLDLEGIACDAEGNFYLASEARFRILYVSRDGRDVSWITPSLRSVGQRAGLFRVPGAYLEGISRVGPKQFILCAERQPRGLIEVDLSSEQMAATAFLCDETRFVLPKKRSPDFTALHWDGESLYALARNAYLVCQMFRSGMAYEEGLAWSYESIVTSDELRYANMEYGQAEGLCMDDERVYVILDNNGMPRESLPDDKRPLLLIMERPGK